MNEIPETLVEDTSPKMNDLDDNEMPDCIAQYFSIKEVTDVIQEAKKPLKKVEAVSEVSSAESDSEPSCDNFDSVDISENFKNVLDEKQLETFLDLKRKS